MFIIHGTTNKTRYRGVVADRCPVCGDVQACNAYEDYSVRRLYIIPLGRGTRTGATRQCRACGTRAGAAEDAYEVVLKDLEARSLSLEELVERTNPRLVMWQREEQLWQECLRRPCEGSDDA